MIDFDVLLRSLGSFGTYQIVVFAALLYYQVPSGMNTLASVFISYTPAYRCQMPFDVGYSTNLSDLEKTNLTTPLNENNEPNDPCVRYAYNVTECEIAGDLSCVEMHDDTMACESYYFDDSIFTETTVTEFELVCEKGTLDAVGTITYYIGILLGALVFGNIADRISESGKKDTFTKSEKYNFCCKVWFGRRRTILLTTYGLLLCMLGTAYSNSVALFFFFRFATAVLLAGTNIGIFTYLMEIVGCNWRTFVGIGYQVGFAIGYMLWTPVAQNYRDWHQMMLGALVLSSPFAVIVLLVPESPRWLFTTGLDEKGKKIIGMMERINKVTIDEETWLEAERSGNKKLEQLNSNQYNTYSTRDLFRSIGITKVTAAITFSWFANGLVYYGISLNAGSLAGDIFLNNIYSGVFEIVSYIICILIMDYVGRRLLLSVTFFGAGITLLSATIVNEYAEQDRTLITLGLAFSFMARGFISGCYAVIYNFTGELYPTVVRGCGVGLGSVCANIGSILAPLLTELDQFSAWLPNSILGTFALVGGGVGLYLRDTTGMGMMETIEEAELFYKGGRRYMGDWTKEVENPVYESEYEFAEDEPPNKATKL